MTLDDWRSIAQIIATVLMGLGVCLSFWVSIRSLKEAQLDRRLRQQPHLAFNRGGNYIPVIFEKNGLRIPGMNPLAVEQEFSHLPKDCESVRVRVERTSGGKVKGIYHSSIRNYGEGPALNVVVRWIPNEIEVRGERFELSKEKLLEPAYSASFNTLPAVPAHIPSGESSKFTRLPTFINKDVERKITVVTGHLEIIGTDIFKEQHKTYQEFRISTHYTDDEPHVVLTYGATVEKI